MVRLLIPVLLLALGLGAGVAAGLVLGPETDVGPEADGNAQRAAAAGREMDGDLGSDVGGDPGFVRLNNQFVVPVVREGRVRSVVVLSLSIEMTGEEANAAVFALEPRLRDAFLQVMFAHANAGGFDGHFTSTGALAPLRQGLREAARGILGPTVTDVLIIDIARQDA